MEILRAVMATLHILWFNLAIQCITVLLCLRIAAIHGMVQCLGGQPPRFDLMLADVQDRRSDEWHLDPLTQALTELAAAKARIAEFETRFVTKNEFLPVQRAVYGMIAVVGTTAITSLLFLVWKGGKP